MGRIAGNDAGEREGVQEGAHTPVRESMEAATMKLRFAEEITLLMLDDEDGEFVRVPGWSMQCAFAGRC